MKKEYNLRDKVWIHVGEKNLVEGRVVEIIDLEHLNEGHSKDNELYIIEIDTSIDPIYEVRTWEQISPDAKGPIQLFRQASVRSEKRLLAKIGVELPVDDEWLDENDPTPEQINAAIDAAEKAKKDAFTLAEARPKKRTYPPRNKSGARKPKRPTTI